MPSSRRRARSGRASGRSASPGRRRRPDQAGAEDAASDDRRSSKDSGRGSGRKPGDQTTLWIGLAGGAVVLLIILLIAFSGGRRRPSPKASKPKPEPVVRPMRRDWRQVGFDRGLDWKKVVTRRRTAFTRAEAKETAELMTSDYTRKGISERGEKAFVRGFMQAACGD